MTRTEERTTHRCHAIGCQTPVAPRLHMCRRHWFMVPEALRAALWAAYVPGQEDRKDPTDEYLRAARACIEAVAAREGVIATLVPMRAAVSGGLDEQLGLF